MKAPDITGATRIIRWLSPPACTGYRTKCLASGDLSPVLLEPKYCAGDEGGQGRRTSNTLSGGHDYLRAGQSGLMKSFIPKKTLVTASLLSGHHALTSFGLHAGDDLGGGGKDRVAAQPGAPPARFDQLYLMRVKAGFGRSG